MVSRRPSRIDLFRISGSYVNSLLGYTSQTISQLRFQ
jgi:hypothetical protein